MKNIEIINGENTFCLAVENKNEAIEVKKEIGDLLEQGSGILEIETPEMFEYLPYEFLSNSVIKFPKFD